jgi:hypothetical protein
MDPGSNEKSAPDRPFLLGGHGGRRNRGSKTTLIGRGRAYALARDRPDLAARVREGSMSAHAAAVEAAFRKTRRQDASPSPPPAAPRLEPDEADDPFAIVRALIG